VTPPPPRRHCRHGCRRSPPPTRAQQARTLGRRHLRGGGAAAAATAAPPMPAANHGTAAATRQPTGRAWRQRSVVGAATTAAAVDAAAPRNRNRHHHPDPHPRPCTRSPTAAAQRALDHHCGSGGSDAARRQCRPPPPAPPPPDGRQIGIRVGAAVVHTSGATAGRLPAVAWEAGAADMSAVGAAQPTCSGRVVGRNISRRHLMAPSAPQSHAAAAAAATVNTTTMALGGGETQPTGETTTTRGATGRAPGPSPPTPPALPPPSAKSDHRPLFVLGRPCISAVAAETISAAPSASFKNCRRRQHQRSPLPHHPSCPHPFPCVVAAAPASQHSPRHTIHTTDMVKSRPQTPPGTATVVPTAAPAERKSCWRYHCSAGQRNASRVGWRQRRQRQQQRGVGRAPTAVGGERDDRACAERHAWPLSCVCVPREVVRLGDTAESDGPLLGCTPVGSVEY